MKHMLIMISHNITNLTCILSHFIEFHSAVAVKKLNIAQLFRGHGNDLCFFFIGPKNTNLVEEVEILASYQDKLNSVYKWLTRRSISKIYRPIRGQDSHLVSNQLENRGCWHLATCQVSLNFVSNFIEVQNVSANRSKGGHLVFSAPEQSRRLKCTFLITHCPSIPRPSVFNF